MYANCSFKNSSSYDKYANGRLFQKVTLPIVVVVILTPLLPFVIHKISFANEFLAFLATCSLSVVSCLLIIYTIGCSSSERCFLNNKITLILRKWKNKKYRADMALGRILAIYWVVLIQHNFAPYHPDWAWVGNGQYFIFDRVLDFTSYITLLTMPLCFLYQVLFCIRRVVYIKKVISYFLYK